jgi:hypothetical protein
MGKAKIDTPGSAHAAMEWRLEKADSLLGGTETMRAAGQTFLPKYSQETTKNWKSRLNRAVLFNYYKRTARTLGGKPFSRDLKVEDADQKVQDCLDDINLQGDDFHVVAQREFTLALCKGLAIFLVDFPTNTAPNAAAEKAQHLRPYLVPIAPENLLAAYTGVNENGEEIVTHARIYSEDVERVEYDEIKVETIMVYEPGKWEKWVRRAPSKVYAMESSGVSKLAYVPLLCFYTEKEAPFVSRPTLEDLADKNIEHWQSSSDQRHCLTVARFPMLAGKGIQKTEGEVVKVGPYETLFAENEHSEFYYVEHTGAALAAGVNDLDSIKGEMAVLALELTTPKDRQTATSAMLDAGDHLSVLQMLSISFEDFLERVLVVMGDWMDVPAEKCGDVKLHKEFNLSGLDAKMLDALVAARNAGDLDSKTFLLELQRRGYIGADWDVDELVKAAQAESDVRAKKAMDLAIRAKQATQPATKPEPKSGDTGSTAGGKTPPA